MGRKVLQKSRKILIITAAAMLMLAPLANSENVSEQSPDVRAKQRVLNQEAANALWRLQNSLANDGFYSARIRLNVWRSAAIEAGTFDQDQYDKFKKQLYEKSISDSLQCFEEFILEGDFYNANICLQTWRMHSRELGTYDPAKYEALKEKLKEARQKKDSEEAVQPKPD